MADIVHSHSKWPRMQRAREEINECVLVVRLQPRRGWLRLSWFVILF